MRSNSPPVPTPFVKRAADRALAARHRATVDDITRILDAALELAAERAPEPPRVSDIVTAAGTSNQTFYRYFKSKDELFIALQERGSARLVTYLEHVMGKERDPWRQVGCWIEGVLLQVAKPATARLARAVLIQVSHISPERVTTDGDNERLVRHLLLSPLERGGSRDPERDALTIADTVFGMVRRCVWAPGYPSEEDIAHVTSFCLRGVSSVATAKG